VETLDVLKQAEKVVVTVAAKVGMPGYSSLTVSRAYEFTKLTLDGISADDLRAAITEELTEDFRHYSEKLFFNGGAETKEQKEPPAPTSGYDPAVLFPGVCRVD